MPMNKPHLEFHPVDLNEGWHTPAGYPAVHNMPPPRPNTVLTADEAKKAQDDLAALRTRQEKAAGTLNASGTTGSIPKDQQAQQ